MKVVDNTFFSRLLSGGGGGGRGFSDIFICRWGSKFEISMFLGGFQKNDFFGGMKILEYFLRVIAELDYI